jgi:hypothetical protein
VVGGGQCASRQAGERQFGCSVGLRPGGPEGQRPGGLASGGPAGQAMS